MCFLIDLNVHVVRYYYLRSLLKKTLVNFAKVFYFHNKPKKYKTYIERAWIGHSFQCHLSKGFIAFPIYKWKLTICPENRIKGKIFTKSSFITLEILCAKLYRSLPFIELEMNLPIYKSSWTQLCKLCIINFFITTKRDSNQRLWRTPAWAEYPSEYSSKS